MHLGMERAEVSVHWSSSPASVVLTGNDSQVGRFILTEVQSLSGEKLMSNSRLEISIRNFAIFIGIKFIEKIVKVFIFNDESPMFQIVTELIFGDDASFF